MTAKIKMLAKKAMAWAAECRDAFAAKISPLMASKENRLLLLLIGVVLALLVLAVILFFGIDWHKSVGICYRDDTDASNSAYRQVLERTLSQKGYSVIVADADGDQARQLEQIGQMAKKDCDAILVEPVMLSAGQELSDAIAAADMPCVLLSRQPEGMTEQLPCVYTDEGNLGALLGQMVVQLPNSGDINGDGAVSCLLIYGTQQNTEGARLSEGFGAAFTGSQVQPQIQYSGWGKWTRDGGKQVCRESLAAYGKDIEVILCVSDAMALGALDAITDGGRSVGKDVYLYSVGGGEEVCREVHSGQITGALRTDLQQQADAAVEALLAQLDGKSARSVSIAEYVRVTQENAGQYLAEE
ncbi:MAG: sugar ABC transporter substrate-binding protein [Oscillospiraceae bacterium]|nr:sugar ABC transporter substrate-binding protein [Oscillospiraceae bacterium]